MNVITLGTFDILHAGHVRLLKFCKKLAGDGKFVVGLNTDPFILRYRGKTAVMNYDERRTFLEELEIADLVVPNSQDKDGIKPLIDMHNIDMIVVGSDWARKDYMAQVGLTWDWLESNKVALCYFPRSLQMSSSQVKERIRQ